MSEIDRNRQLRRRHMHERQAVIFGVLLAAMALIGLGAAAVFTGNLDLPGLDRAIAQEPSPTEVMKPYPCPPVGAKPVAAASIKVNVNNATSRAGLAAATAAALQERGFVIGTKTTVEPYDGVARISFGKNGIAQAYTLLAHFDGATMFPLAVDNATVSVALGAQFDTLKPLDQVGLDPAVPLVAPAGCTPYEEFASTTVTPAATPAG
ncbi:LytR C-terminal domain-containing protein [Cellulomonas sp. URHD0024]|uniref:LytR C-terminal domain-containing protein n=1 Tax=Cellulomonas sp. URHD0024 TaxID=1302620 RepID=UPI0003FCDC84|nr:LytR C-terminal domain-containing protein [Cellulomonas sp. URHD0024]